MAGMFYSLEEAAEKLNTTEEEVKELAKEGKLREFRDGSNLLFKVDEVEALVPETGAAVSQEEPVPSEEPTEPEPAIELEGLMEPVDLEESGQAPISEQMVEPEATAEPEQPAEEDEILLAPETGAPAVEGDLTSADTALTGEGVSVLGETDRDYQVTDDTMGETTGTMGTTGTTPEASLEEIEEDVNLDSFGSGSGLLDLSLQADDTSLGGILDEIYTTEGGEEEPGPAEASSAVEVAPGPEQMLVEEDLVGPQVIAQAPAMAQAFVEPEPDVQSNTLGMLLFLPLLVLLYTAVAVVAGLRGVVPSILAAIQGAIWYIMIGAIVVAGAIVAAAFMLSGDFRTGLAKKEKKPKKSRKSKKTPPAAPEETAA
jgi:excisionase family DNA binding protein